MQMGYVVFEQCDNQDVDYQFYDGNYQCQQQFIGGEGFYLFLWNKYFDEYLQYYQLFQVDILFYDVKVVVVIFREWIFL